MDVNDQYRFPNQSGDAVVANSSGPKIANLDRDPNQNEILDIVDVLGFLWRARLYLVIGTFLGLGSAFIGSAWKKSRPFSSYPLPIAVPLSISGERVDLKVRDEEFVAEIQDIMVQKQFAELLYDELIANHPTAKTKLEAAGISRDVFIDYQVGNRGPNAYVLRARYDRELVATIVDSQLSSLSVDSTFVSEAVAAFVAILPKHLDINRIEFFKKWSEVKNALQKQIDDIAKNLASERSQAQLQVQDMEADVLRKLSNRSALSAVGKDDQVLRFLAIAVLEGKVDRKNAEALAIRRDELLAKAAASELVYGIEFERKRGELTKVEEQMEGSLRSHLVSNRIKVQINQPLYNMWVATNLAAADAKGKFGIGAFIAFCVMGALLGLVAYGSVQFIKHNRARFEAIFHDQK